MSERAQNRSEQLIATALREQFGDDAIILNGVRFTDGRHGDVEVDALVFIPDVGVAVIEVKGGLVEYRDGHWRVQTRRGSRRCHPVQQARAAKHAVRAFLDRQSEWHQGMVRAAWFVAMPFTTVDRDFGPEGRREQLIGKNDVAELRERIHAVLDSPEIPEPRPSREHLELAADLLTANARSLPQRTRSFLRRWAWWLSILLFAAAAGGVWLYRHEYQHRTDLSPGCSPYYSPCVPVRADMDCPQIRHQVTVIKGRDPYNLDADGDKIGCEWWPR